jgi:hypothetical protein
MAAHVWSGKLDRIKKKKMQITETESGLPRSGVNRTRYRIVNHKEAGLFDSMTDATLWALKNLSGWNWRIEPVSGHSRCKRHPTT